jgi:hypothetical protein
MICDLELDVALFADVEVHCMYTPHDLMIVPAASAVIADARSVHRIPVPIHRMMLRDPRVLDIVARLLRA